MEPPLSPVVRPDVVRRDPKAIEASFGADDREIGEGGTFKRASLLSSPQPHPPPPKFLQEGEVFPV